MSSAEARGALAVTASTVGAFLVASALLMTTALAAGPADDLVQSVTDAPESFFDTVKEVFQRIIHFFKEASYVRVILLGGFFLGALFIWRKYGGRR